MENKEEMVTISKSRYDYLVDRNRWLRALELNGVDNWYGYDEAWDDYNDLKEYEKE